MLFHKICSISKKIEIENRPNNNPNNNFDSSMVWALPQTKNQVFFPIFCLRRWWSPHFWITCVLAVAVVAAATAAATVVVAVVLVDVALWAMFLFIISPTLCSTEQKFSSPYLSLKLLWKCTHAHFCFPLNFAKWKHFRVVLWRVYIASAYHCFLLLSKTKRAHQR